jgi:hypothetical protein
VILRDGTHEVQIIREGQTFNKANLPYFFNSISQVEAKVEYRVASSVKVTFSPSYNDGIRILESGLLGTYAGKKDQKPEPSSGTGISNISSQPMSSSVATPVSSSDEDFLDSNTAYIMVKFLYPDQLDSEGSPLETPWYTGFLMPPTIGITGSEISITINCVGTMSILSFVEGAFSYKNKPALDVLTELAAKAGLVLDYDEKDKVTKAALKKLKITGVWNEPKFQTIKFILHQVGCYWTETAGDDPTKPKATLKIMLRSNTAEQKVIYTFVMYRQIDPTNNIIPIFDFSFGGYSGNLFSPGAAFGTFQRCINEKTNKVVKIKTGIKDVKKSKTLSGSGAGSGAPPKSAPQIDGGGAGGLVDTKDKEIAGASKIAVMNSEASNVDEIKSSQSHASQLGPIYTLLVPGLPRLKTHALAQVIVGENIPGLTSVGQITSVTHLSNADGWTSQVIIRQTAGLGTFLDSLNKGVEKDKIKAEAKETTSNQI